MRLMLCPDIETDYSKYQLDGSYNDMKRRQSFSVDVFQCDASFNLNCKSLQEQERLLKSWYFTLYTLNERVDFTKPSGSFLTT